MAENNARGFLAAQIEQAQRNLESWPEWLKEATQLESSGSDDSAHRTQDPRAGEPER
jgi:hypothetical protein